MRTVIDLLALAALLAAGTTACGTDTNGLPTEWRFDNQTERPLTVVWERDSGERVELTTVEPGARGTVSVNRYGNPRYVCEEGEIAALDPDGVEIGRWPTTCEIVEVPVPTPVTGGEPS